MRGLILFNLLALICTKLAVTFLIIKHAIFLIPQIQNFEEKNLVFLYGNAI